ncbi:MAG TPA: sigma-70 family RNA polymerase sigma factor [Gemmataceae bacterium]|nr:sigma-70 family RNA polymerase sigma factor [Gemmataceae bacterium]
MSAGRMSTIGQCLSDLRGSGAGGQTDGQLLQSFIDCRDGDAVTALVRRHGPMVLGVCRRVLGGTHDAEDAFQATFLVLVRKATSIVPRELVGNWLYGVAYRTALEARARNARRRAREKQVRDMPDHAVESEAAWPELEPLLDRELSRLPEKYRAPVVLCELQGRSRSDAARQLNLPEGTLSSRLATARRMLAGRLGARGLALSAGGLTSVLVHSAVSASVPPPLLASTAKAATLTAAGQAVGTVVSANVAALTEGVLKTMFLAKLKVAAVALVAAGVLAGAGGRLVMPQAQAEKPGDKVAKDAGHKNSTELSAVVKAVDASRGVLTTHPSKTTPEEQSFNLAKGVKVFLDDGTGDKLGFSEGKIGDVADGSHVTLRLSPENKEVVGIWVEGPSVQGILKAADATRNTITASVSTHKGEPPADTTFKIARNARLEIDDGQPKDKTKPATEPTLADLPANAQVTLRLSADRKVVGSIRAEGLTVSGTVKALDADKNTITITVGGKKGEPGEDKSFTVAANVPVYIDDGKVKDKKKAESLGDLPVGSTVTLRLSLDQKSVVSVRAEGGSVQGSVKSVDAAGDKITLHDKAQGEKTYNVMKDAPVVIDDHAAVRKLADVPVESMVNLKLLADQTTVRAISVHGPTATGNVKGTAGPDHINLENKEGEKSFALAKDVRIMIDEHKKGKLSDLIEGTVAQLRLSADQSSVLEIHATGPSFRGRVKFVDADKNLITLTIGGKNGVGGEDKDFTLSKDTAVATETYGAPLKLSDVRTDREVILRLAIDQKAAARIIVLGE